ncbi:MAG: TolC family protein, partial [Alteraurantiacibacter sp.]
LLQLSQNEITGARAAVVLRSQFGPGLSQLSTVEASDARITRAIAEFGESERTLREQLRRDYVLVRASERRIEAGVLAADAADDIIASYQRQFIAGRRSWLDVMNAVREAANARLSESDARVGAAAATARVLALTCRWQPDEGPEIQP